MAVTVEKVGNTTWVYTWSGGVAPYDVYQDGQLVLNQSSLTSLTVEGSDSEEPPAIEVRDSLDSGEPESTEFSPLLVIQWRGELTASHYTVEEFVDPDWIERKTIVELALGYYRDTTLALADVTDHSWRVKTIDESDNESQPLLVDTFKVRNPPPPSIDATYSSGTGLVTIAAR